jgi:general secretion pathway protein G
MTQGKSSSPQPAGANSNRAAASAAQRGFTLIELMIVIVLIAAIATVVGTRILGAADRGKFHLEESHIEALASKIDAYQQDVGSLPPSLDALVKAPGESTGWLGPYAKQQDLKDQWGHPIDYHVPGTNGAFDLVSYGKDGKPGGEGYDADIHNK